MKNLSTFVRTSGNQFIAGKKFFTTSIAVFGSLADGGNSIGTNGQVLVSTGSGVVWADSSSVSAETLHTVTTRGNTTTNSITVGGLRVDDTTLYVDAANNRVGIGTLTPQHKLQVEGGTFADYFQLDTTYSNGNVQGNISWDPDNNTALLGLDGDISLRVGQDDMWFVKNQTGATIAKGSVVYASGTLGSSGRILAAKMVADGSIAARYILGIAAEDITNGSDGYVLAKGKIRQLDTSAFTEGSVLWVSPTTAGALTATEPSAPNLKLPVAFVVKSAGNGTLAVRVETGVRISDASDVQITSVANKNILRYSSANSRWENVPGNTGYIDEGVNLYFTEQRARNSISAGTGISYNSSTGVITNSAPDQVVSLTGAGTTAITGTYPNFTITSNDQYVGTVTSVGVSAGTGISVAGSPITSSGTITITNTAPDQVVGLSAGTGISVSGTYPNFTITNTSPSSGGTVTGTGTVNYVSKWGSSTGLVNSQIFDNGTNVGIGTTSPQVRLTLRRENNGSLFELNRPASDVEALYGGIVGNDPYFYSNNGIFTLGINNPDGGLGGEVSYITMRNGSTRYTTFEAGNVGIGTTSPGYKLDVAGTISNNSGQNFIYSTYDDVGALFQRVGTYGAIIRIGRKGVSNSTTIDYPADGTFAVSTASSERLRITNSGNVGIGTTSPAYKLDVAGEGKVTGKFRVGGAVMLAEPGTGVLLFGSEGGSQTAIYSASLERIRINSSGNVGIGTTSPNEKLSVNGNIESLDTFILNYGNNGIKWQQLFDGANSWNLRYFNGSWSSSAITVTSAGNVGIGTTSPAQKLDVVGSAKIQGNIQLTGQATGYETSFNGSSIYSAASTFNGEASMFGALVLQSRGDSGRPIVFVTGGTPAERMRIDSSGNVGIGTTSPETRLHLLTSTTDATQQLLIQNGSTGDAAIKFNISGDTYSIGIDNSDSDKFKLSYGSLGTSDRIVVDSSGNVGIGTAGPNGKLEVAGDIYVNGADKKIMNYAGAVDYGTLTNNSVRFNTNGTEKFRISGDGNVGIGTTSPSSKLTVQSGINTSSATVISLLQTTNGAEKEAAGLGISIQNGGESTNAADFWFKTASGGATSERMRITSAGNVGIGTTSPTGKLHVAGTGATQLYISTTSTTSEPQIIFIDGSNDYFAIQKADRGIAFKPQGAESMRIDGDGNVGIGTATPSLDSAGIGLEVVNSSYTQLKVRSTASSAGIEFKPNTGDSWEIQANNTNKWFVYNRTDGAYRLLIDDVGNVGIGTTSPGARLEVSDNTTGIGAIVGNTTHNSRLQIYTAAVSKNSEIWFGDAADSDIGKIDYDHANNSMSFTTNASERLRITSAGNVGIGTTSPTAKLQVSDGDILANKVVAKLSLGPVGSSGDAIFGSSGIAGTPAVGQQDYGYYAAHNAYRESNGAWKHIRTSTIPAIRNLGSAGVSQGTSGFYWDYSPNVGTADISWTNLMRLTTSGNLGIGNTAPTQKLHVTGNVRVTGAYYDSNNEAGTSGQVLTSTATGTDWKSLSEITGVDGTGTANYVAKWSDTDTITNSQIQDNGTTVGIGVAPGNTKLTVAGSIAAGGKITYTKSYASIDTTGQAVGGISSSGNGASSLFEFTCNGGSGQYQRIIYACWNAGGTWNTRKVVDEGTNELDVVASANAATITFTFKGRTSSQSYSPRVTVEVNGNVDTSYL